ncbi:cysteine desulfurase CsdA [Candidatus Woesearchaeota archaeon]|nr:cysteine desulfurase CsdA [Candidatus Woesearchaeota archaeon]
MKQDFPLLKKTVYLDSASTTQKPGQVMQAMQTYYEEYNANVHRGIYSLSEESTALYENGRKAVAQFINASANNIVFTKGATESLNLVAQGLGLTEQDEVIISIMEHHANMVPWQQTQATIKYAPMREGKLDMDALAKLITQKTRVISVCHISNAIGVENPIKDIAKLAHDHGILLVVDAAQSIGHKPVDVQDLGADFVAFSAHKMFGPMGVGVLYGKIELLTPLITGGGSIQKVTTEGTEFQPGPHGFEAGTPNVAGVVGLTSAIAYLHHHGMNKIGEHIKDITAYATQQLAGIPNLTIKGSGNGIVSFTVENVHSHDVTSILSEQGVCVRAGHHCAMPLMEVLGIKDCVRASFHAYTTKEDVDTLVKGLAQVKEVFA